MEASVKQCRSTSILVVVALGSMAVLVGCTSDDSNNNSTPLTVVSVTENITTPTTWTATNLYLLENSIQVLAALTIEPGTILKLTDGASITVGTAGSIIADAHQATTPCTFTSSKDDLHGGDTNGDGDATAPAPGDWGYVNVTVNGTVFNYCQFLYGGKNAPYTGTLAVKGGVVVSVTNCIFAHNKGGTPDDLRAAAFNASGVAAGSVITGDTFFDNDLPLVINGDIDIDNSNVFRMLVADVLFGNAYNGIFWAGNYETSGNIAWTNTEVPYVFSSSVSVPVGATLTLGDGVTIKLDQGERLEVAGTLNANATAGIFFTSLKDDSVGGDTNGDGATTVAAPGDWAFVNILGDGSVLNRIRFSYGGSNEPYSGTVMVTHNHAATITNCTFAHNAGGTLSDNRAAALNLAGATAATITTGNTFYDNDMPMVINGLVSVDDSNVFHGGTPEVANKYNGIFMDGVAHAVNASTTWSETEVPFVMMGGTVLSIATSGTLSLGNDVVLKFDAGRLDLMGTLTEGTGNYYTSLNDDALKGDTNGDATASTPVKGDWAGIDICIGGCAWATWGNILYATNPP
jgi:hypothetical protein